VEDGRALGAAGGRMEWLWRIECAAGFEMERMSSSRAEDMSWSSRFMMNLSRRSSVTRSRSILNISLVRIIKNE
jgi:hypothetical protein